MNELKFPGKVGCHVVNDSKILKDVRRHVVELTIAIRIRFVSRSLAFILGALLAVEYLANLSRITLVFSKSFKAMILGSNFI